MGDNIVDILKNFKPITLKELEVDLLLDRIDTKFIFHLNKLPSFLEKILPVYSVLDINNIRVHNYESLYFDTDNFALFLQHHNVLRNRFKVRFRRYVDTNISFFEIKLKNNKNRTIKKRIPKDSVDFILKDDAKDFLFENLKINPNNLSAKLWVYYFRITLVNNYSKERVTIDLKLNLKNYISNLSYPQLVVAEIKQENPFRSDFLSLMQKSHILPVDISKYCLGIAMMEKNVKKNNFKHNILSINKLCHD